MWWRVFVVWLRCLYGDQWPEASGQRDERPPSTAEHPDHDFVLSEPSLAVVMDQSLVPGRSAAVVIGDGGNIICRVA